MSVGGWFSNFIKIVFGVWQNNERWITRSQVRENRHTEVENIEKKRSDNESQLSGTGLSGLISPVLLALQSRLHPFVSPNALPLTDNPPICKACVAHSRACVPQTWPAISVGLPSVNPDSWRRCNIPVSWIRGIAIVNGKIPDGEEQVIGSR